MWILHLYMYPCCSPYCGNVNASDKAPQKATYSPLRLCVPAHCSQYHHSRNRCRLLTAPDGETSLFCLGRSSGHIKPASHYCSFLYLVSTAMLLIYLFVLYCCSYLLLVCLNSLLSIHWLLFNLDCHFPLNSISWGLMVILLFNMVSFL